MIPRSLIVAGLILACLGATARSVAAHEVRPGYLELREGTSGLYAMTWKVPALGEFRLSVVPILPQFCHLVRETTSIVDDGFSITRGDLRCTQPLAGNTLRIGNLEATQTDVLVRIQSADGHVETDRLTPASPSTVVRTRQTAWEVLTNYGALGIEHILTGADHLLFVLCLILLVQNVRMLVATVTAFTVAHSISLTAATLGLVHVPSAPVEATIALSIVILATELARDGKGMARTYPWLVAFCFGLLHGLGFAGALAEIGLPQGEIPIALFAFNVGVEIGQLAFIAAALAALAGGRRAIGVAPAWTTRLASYAIGTIASFWMFERIASG